MGAPVVGIAESPQGGYWQVSSDGTVFTHGTTSFGSMAGQHLNAPIVGIAATANGGGYYLVAADGGVFAFGDAAFMGSMASQPLNAPIVGIAATADNQGYFLAASDGGVFAFGDAQFQGSMSGKALTRPIVGVAVDGAHLRLLAGGRRRWGVFFWIPVPWLDWSSTPQRPGGWLGRHRRRPRVSCGRSRRRRLRIRHSPVLWVVGRRDPQPAGGRYRFGWMITV